MRCRRQERFSSKHLTGDYDCGHYHWHSNFKSLSGANSPGVGPEFPPLLSTTTAWQASIKDSWLLGVPACCFSFIGPKYLRDKTPETTGGITAWLNSPWLSDMVLGQHYYSCASPIVPISQHQIAKVDLIIKSYLNSAHDLPLRYGLYALDALSCPRVVH